jgi:hypothetical protein
MKWFLEVSDVLLVTILETSIWKLLQILNIDSGKIQLEMWSENSEKFIAKQANEEKLVH